MAGNVVVVTRSVPSHPGAGGMERQSWDLARRLCRTFSVSVLTTAVPGRPASFVEDGLPVVTVPGTRPGRYGLRWWLATARRRVDADLVLSVSAAATSMSLTRRSPAYVFQAHGTALAELAATLRGRPRLWLAKAARLAWWAAVDWFTYRRMDAVVAAGEQVARRLGRRPYRLPTVLIPNGVPVPEQPVPRSGGDVVAVTVSRLTRQKGVDQALAALPHSNVRLLVVGSGDEESALRRLATDLGVADRATFTGHVDEDGVADALAAADVFVFPVRNPEREGLPMAVLEALASGLPVLVPVESTWPDDLAPLLTFVDMGDPAAVAKALAVGPVTHRPSRLPYRYTMEGSAQAYEETITRLLTSPSRSRGRRWRSARWRG